MGVEPLIVYLKRNVGAVRSWRVCLYVASWGLYSDSLPGGDLPSMQGYADFWKMSRAKAYRERELFVKSFPQFDTPEPIYRSVRSELDRKSAETAAAKLVGMRRDWAAL